MTQSLSETPEPPKWIANWTGSNRRKTVGVELGGVHDTRSSVTDPKPGVRLSSQSSSRSSRCSHELRTLTEVTFRRGGCPSRPSMAVARSLAVVGAIGLGRKTRRTAAKDAKHTVQSATMSIGGATWPSSIPFSIFFQCSAARSSRLTLRRNRLSCNPSSERNSTTPKL